MNGILVSEIRAYGMHCRGHETYLSPSTGHWVRTDNIARAEYTYYVYRSGDAVDEIPADAWAIDDDMWIANT